MKRLTLLRHAKSSWKDLSLPDADRKLNKRGKRTAPEMGTRFATRYSVEDVLLVSSPAKRAITTARLFALAAGMAEDRIQEEELIYQADARALLQIVRGLDDAWDHVVLVGHNPGFTDFINSATKHFIENLPTAGIAVLQYPVDHWADVGAAPAVLADLAVPAKKNA
jgi:phosphohistidine phosphatase